MDSTHAAIRDAFRSMGFAVYDSSRFGQGFGDLVVSRDMQTAIIECKSPGGKLTPDQVKFHGEWRGRIYIVVTVGDVEQISRHWLTKEVR